MSQSLERLQKVIAKSGVASRRKAEKLIADGKVKVNDEVVTELGTKVSQKDKISVNNIEIEKEVPVYYLLYKPRGVISSVKDDKNRQVVTDLIDANERVFPIGRLDYNSSGLLLMTNDGDFANLLMHPRYEIEKVYYARIEGVPEKSELNKLLSGIKESGELLKVVQYKVVHVDKQKKRMDIELTLKEGKNRHIRRMMDSLGYPILKLKRIKYGFLTLNHLNVGQYRSLTPKEIKQMRNMALKNVEE